MPLGSRPTRFRLNYQCLHSDCVWLNERINYEENAIGNPRRQLERNQLCFQLFVLSTESINHRGLFAVRLYMIWATILGSYLVCWGCNHVCCTHTLETSVKWTPLCLYECLPEGVHKGVNWTHQGRDKMADFSQTTFSNAFSSKKMLKKTYSNFTEICSSVFI